MSEREAHDLATLNMALFGFPDKFSDYEAKHYLRLVVIVLFYITIRPIFVKIGERIQKTQYDEVSLRKIAQAAKERDEKELEEKVAEAKKAEAEADTTSSKKTGAESSALKKADGKLKNRKAPSKTKASKQAGYPDMPSDDDVSDLLADA